MTAKQEKEQIKIQHNSTLCLQLPCTLRILHFNCPLLLQKNTIETQFCCQNEQTIINKNEPTIINKLRNYVPHASRGESPLSVVSNFLRIKINSWMQHCRLSPLFYDKLIDYHNCLNDPLTGNQKSRILLSRNDA